MNLKKLVCLLAAGLLPPVASHAAEVDAVDQSAPRVMDTITVSGGRPSSLPNQIPTTIEGISGQQVERSINATDSEDALKYFPSLNVRKRYAGDYDHAVLASRASGTGNSARSLVYADGILLSNLLGNGATYTPRWGLVTPEEIERVDVLYGPFSAAYPGNSVGAVVDYVTRLPQKFEAHMKLSGYGQRFSQYGTDASYSGAQGSASIGNKNGGLAWWLDVSRQDNEGQPLGFVNRLLTAGTPGNGGVPVSGAVADKNPSNRDWVILGANSQVHTVQDHAKLKLGYDLTPGVAASYTLGLWRNEADRSAASYLRDAAGNVINGSAAQPDINVNGRSYRLAPADFAPGLGSLEHVMHGLAVKSHTKALWDWELAASLYDYRKDAVRAPLVFLPAAGGNGSGSLTDMAGSGWHTLAAKGLWRPEAHVVEFGLQGDYFKLRTLVSGTADWINSGAGARISAFNGNASLQSFYAQDTWRLAPQWKAMLGARAEEWQAWGGELGNAATLQSFGARREHNVSPKAALSYAATKDWTLKASLGRAVRYPTVAELYQGAIVANVITNNDPNLKPEKSWTSEWTAERDLGDGTLRATVFHETTRDALYSQTNVTVTPNVTNIQNVGQMRTSGLELAYQQGDVVWKGLDLSASMTYTDSLITQNANFPQSVGKQQPRVPKWRATMLATYSPDAQWSASLGARYSGRQFSTLDNSDPNGFSYTGVSRFFVTDVRLKYRFAPQWSAAVGIDNLNNAKYWAFHRYTERTLVAELRFDM